MAGSQLKQLREALKSNGLIGQTNVKKKNRKSKTPSETRRNDKEKIIGNIRDQFNQFDQRVNRNKHDITTIAGGKFVKVGSKQHNDVTRSKSNVEKSLKMQYELERSNGKKTGGLVDRRFGERNKDLSSEEKMLERFTRERQASSKKNNFSLESDEEVEDEDGFILTHSGKALKIDDEDDDIDDGSLGAARSNYADEDQSEGSAPARKKSKHEVMKEIIAKSKFHKQQRQADFQKAQDEIMDLDEDFGDVMQAINSSSAPANKFSNKTPEEIEYDSKVRELTYDRRAAPADRTKTIEELERSRKEKMDKLEADRQKRMDGIADEDRNAEGDDLDVGFWEASDGEDGFSIEKSDKEDSEREEPSEDSSTEQTDPVSEVRTSKSATIMPSNVKEFEDQLKEIDASKHMKYIDDIVNKYKPHLAEGNKKKMDLFVSIIFQYILVLSEKSSVEDNSIEQFVMLLKKFSENYNQSLVESMREQMETIQEHIYQNNVQKSDLVFFALTGYLFSTSDHYHLIVTPSLILMNEYLASVLFSRTTSLSQIAIGIYIADLLLNYQRYSKRFDPEVINFIEKAFLSLVPEPTKLKQVKFHSTSTVFETGLNMANGKNVGTYEDANVVLDISSLFKQNTVEFKFMLIVKLLSILDKIVDSCKELSALPEILHSFIPILKHLTKYYALNLPALPKILQRLIKLQSNTLKDRKPLTLQQHRALSIATFAPKFEENFNPDKKSYDVNRDRQEVNKIKSQIKKERKSTLKDLRKQTRFEAREQIKEKKSMYESYHKKMADIVNSISTVEGAEKNQYEREKKLRKLRK